MLKEAEFGPNLLRHWIGRAAERDPDKAYIVSVDDRRTISYGQLRQLTRQIATFLAERGIRTNDRIAMLSGNDRAPSLLYWRDGLWCHDLHHPC
jgi:acyl-CoA synthetase (AMP-forming)/AMP-acid ligase II